MERETISIRQLTILVMLIIIGDSILVLPSIAAADADQDAWVSGVLGMIIGLFAISLLTRLGGLYPRLNLYEYINKLLGTWLGSSLSLLYAGYFFINAAVHIREIGDFTVTQFMRDTPIQAVHILFLVVIVMGARLGLESLSRTGELFTPWFGILFFVLVVFISPQMDPHRMQPLFEEGIKPILKGSITTTAYPFLEIGSILVILPYVKQDKGLRSSVIWGALLGGVVLNVFIALSIFVLGAYVTSTQMYPGYLLAQKINVGHFLQRIEASLAIMWIITTYFKITLNYTALMLGLAHIAKLKDYRILTLPMAMITLVFSISTIPNVTYFIQLDRIWPYLDLTFSVLFPLLLLGVFSVRKKISSP